MSIIKVNDIRKSFGENESFNQILDGVSFCIEEGEFVSLMGASGSGKSTMLYLIGGLDREFEGSIEICGKAIEKMSEKELSMLRLQKIGFVFQFYNLVQNLTVEENILLPIKMARKYNSDLKKNFFKLLL